MRKKVIIFILLGMIFSLFAKEQIGVCDKSVYNVGIIQNNIPICFYYEDKQGLISAVNIVLELEIIILVRMIQLTLGYLLLKK